MIYPIQIIWEEFIRLKQYWVSKTGRTFISNIHLRYNFFLQQCQCITQAKNDIPMDRIQMVSEKCRNEILNFACFVYWIAKAIRRVSDETDALSNSKSNGNSDDDLDDDSDSLDRCLTNGQHSSKKKHRRNRTTFTTFQLHELERAFEKSRKLYLQRNASNQLILFRLSWCIQPGGISRQN